MSAKTNASLRVSLSVSLAVESKRLAAANGETLDALVERLLLQESCKHEIMNGRLGDFFRANREKISAIIGVAWDAAEKHQAMKSEKTKEGA